MKKATLFELSLESEFGAFSERKPGCSEADVALELSLLRLHKSLTFGIIQTSLATASLNRDFLWFKPKK